VLLEARVTTHINFLQSNETINAVLCCHTQFYCIITVLKLEEQHRGPNFARLAALLQAGQNEHVRIAALPVIPENQRPNIEPQGEI